MRSYVKFAVIALILSLVCAERFDGRGSRAIIKKWQKHPSTASALESIVATSAQVTQAAAPHHQEHHGFSVLGLIINVVADLCPHGMLPLAYGFARGGPSGILPSVLLVAIFGAMSGYSMTAFAGLSEETGSATIADIWGRLISPSSQWIVDAAIFSLCYGCCVFYSAFAGDIFGALSSVLGFTASRANVLLMISTVILLPLCLLQDLSALQLSSFLGVFGILYTVFFHVLRLLDGSYAHGAKLLQHVAPRLLPRHPSPLFSLFRVNTGTLVLGNMLCVAFLAHYNSINYFRELRVRSHTEYVKGIAWGFGISSAVFLAMMFVGYRLFGLSTLPLVLNNFPRTQDPLATLARLAIGAAIVFAYPLMFAGLKSAMFSLMDKMAHNDHRSPSKDSSQLPLVPSKGGSASHGKGATSAIINNKPQRLWQKNLAITTVLASITAIAMQCGEEDVSVVLGIVGSVLGCFVAYFLPAYLKMTHFRQRKRAGLSNPRWEVIANHLMAVLGVSFGALGVWVTMLEASSGAHH